MATIDYLAGTYKERSAPDVVNELSGVCDVWQEGSGHHGYRSCMRGDGFSVFFDGREGMGVHVQASGRGCQLLCEASSDQSVGAAVRMWLGEGMHFTRVDCAVDERNGWGSPEKLLGCLERKTVVSRWQDYQYYGGAKSGVNSGLSVYLGDRSSECYLCCYDKRLERMGAGCDDPGQWCRYELRYKGDAAHSAAVKLGCSASLDWVVRALADAVQVKQPNGGDSNMSRWRDALWWRRTISNAPREPLYVYRPVLSLQEKCEHFRRSYGQALVVLDKACEHAGLTPFFAEELYNQEVRNIRPKNAILISRLAAAAIAAGSRQGRITSDGEVL